MNQIQKAKMSEDAQRHAVLDFLRERLVIYGDVEGKEPFGTAVGHVTIWLPEPTYSGKPSSHRGTMVAFRILKGVENEEVSSATANVPQVEIESISDQL